MTKLVDEATTHTDGRTLQRLAGWMLANPVAVTTFYPPGDLWGRKDWGVSIVPAGTYGPDRFEADGPTLGDAIAGALNAHAAGGAA